VCYYEVHLEQISKICNAMRCDAIPMDGNVNKKMELVSERKYFRLQEFSQLPFVSSL
jgi:hypothetical protein